MFAYSHSMLWSGIIVLRNTVFATPTSKLKSYFLPLALGEAAARCHGGRADVKARCQGGGADVTPRPTQRPRFWLAPRPSARHVPHLVTARSKPVVRLLQGRQPWTPVVRHERHGQRSLPPAAPPTHNPPDVGEGRSEPDRRRREKPSLWRPTLRPHDRGRRPPCVLRRRAAGQATQEAGRAPLRSAPRAASPPSLAPLGCFSSRPRLATAGTGAPTRRGWTLVGAPEP